MLTIDEPQSDNAVKTVPFTYFFPLLQHALWMLLCRLI